MSVYFFFFCLVFSGRCQVRSGCSHRAASSIPSPWWWPQWGRECLCTAPDRWQRGSSWNTHTPGISNKSSPVRAAPQGGLTDCLYDRLFVCESRRRFVMQEVERVCVFVVSLEGKSKCLKRKVWVFVQCQQEDLSFVKPIYTFYFAITTFISKYKWATLLSLCRLPLSDCILMQ